MALGQLGNDGYVVCVTISRAIKLLLFGLDRTIFGKCNVSHFFLIRQIYFNLRLHELFVGGRLISIMSSLLLRPQTTYTYIKHICVVCNH